MREFYIWRYVGLKSKNLIPLKALNSLGIMLWQLPHYSDNVANELW